MRIFPVVRHRLMMSEPVSRPQKMTSMHAMPPGDVLTIPRRIFVRRAIADTERRIEAKLREIDAAIERRALARRIVAVMSVATVLSSIVTLAISFGPLSPISVAVWVVPSALGGSAVAQSVVAMRESQVIRHLRDDAYALRALADKLRSELAVVET